LDVATRKRIIWTSQNLEKWTHYELLQIGRKAEKEEIKKAYRERSKEWHPDRFRSKKLGAFKRLVESVFKRLSEAQRVLTDVKARLAYDQSVVFEPTEEEMKDLMWRAGAEDREKRREESLKQKRIAKNPVLLKKQQAREFYDKALALETEGKLMEARRQAQMAVTYDPKIPEYGQLVERISELAVDHRVAPLLKRAKYHESMTQWDEALEYLTEAVRLAPDNGPARIRMAYNMLMARQDIDEVLRHAQKAVGLVPDDAEAQYVAGRCCEAKLMEKNAKKHYEEALRLRPNFQDAKKRLNKLKWGF
jgi:curved DNA-binding protein CbpA